MKYSKRADEQLDELQRGDDETWNAVCDALEHIEEHTGQAQADSGSFATDDGTVLALPVIGADPLKVFWTTDGPTIKAVFGYPFH